ncbi:MAG: hypothetical protein M3P24_00470 [Gemmatimonadota bacterium]|nr:hypothetical protein [Gemmatimonadota bacterium]
MSEIPPLSSLNHPTVRRALATSLVVGSILTLVNQFPLLAGGSVRLNDLLRIATNYVIPFLVSAYSAHASTPRGALPQMEER